MKRFLPWPGMVFGLIGLNVTIVAITLYFAHSDRSFAVEPDYYQKAVRWDQSAALAAASAKLGWSAEVEATGSGGRGCVLMVRLGDRAGAPVAGASVEVTAFASARASERQRVEMRETEPGVYAGMLSGASEGLWEFSIRAARGEERFELSVERLLTGGSRP